MVTEAASGKTKIHINVDLPKRKWLVMDRCKVIDGAVLIDFVAFFKRLNVSFSAEFLYF